MLITQPSLGFSSLPFPSSPILLLGQRKIAFPIQPGHGKHQLDGPGNPQSNRHTGIGPLQPTSEDTADKHEEDGRDPSVPFHVGARGGPEERVGEQITVQTGEDVGGDLVEPQHAARDDLAAKAKGHQGEGGQGTLVGLVGQAGDLAGLGAEVVEGKGRDGAGLGQRGGDEDEEALDQEGEGQCALALVADAARLAETETAGPEGGDGDDGFDPEGGGAIW